jgi:hypothetical protein
MLRIRERRRRSLADKTANQGWARAGKVLAHAGALLYVAAQAACLVFRAYGLVIWVMIGVGAIDLVLLLMKRTVVSRLIWDQFNLVEDIVIMVSMVILAGVFNGAEGLAYAILFTCNGHFHWQLNTEAPKCESCSC